MVQEVECQPPLELGALTKGEFWNLLLNLHASETDLFAL